MNNVDQQIDLRLRVQPPVGAELYERRMFVPFQGIPRPGESELAVQEAKVLSGEDV